MKKKLSIRVAVFAVAVTCCLGIAPLAQCQQGRPNVIHIFADDLGWGSVGFNNSATHVETPNLDSLARGGLVLNRSYASTVCSPSRANLLTGFHNGHAANDRNGNIGAGIRAQDVTVGEIMTDAGYHTGIIGKWGWGATGNRDLNGSDPLPSINNASTLPSVQGYSEFYGYLNHGAAHDYYYDHMWQSNGIGGNTTVTPNNGGAGNAPEYSHDLFSRRSEAFIRDNANGDPFYLQVNYTIPHFDLEDISTAPPLLDLDGNQIYAGGEAQYAGDGSLTSKQRRYSAMVSRMDASIGALTARLRDPNGDGDQSDSVLGDTLIMFSSDNGTTPEDGLGQSGVNDPRISGGLKGGKRDLYEGGIRMPSFAFWEGNIEAGTESDVLNDLSDFQATAAELADTHARVGTDGVSILPTLLGKDQIKKREYLLFENFENSNMGHKNADWTIIRGDQKLIKFRDGSYELYDLGGDAGENSPLDLAANESLRSELEAIALAEGAAQPDSYSVQFRDWQGADGDVISNLSSWFVTDDAANTAVGSINETWSAVLRNNGAALSKVRMVEDTSVLGIEISGNNATQILEVSEGLNLNGRNEVRIGGAGILQLNNANVVSNRWVEVLDGGRLMGEGAVNSNLYNYGTVAPGFDGVEAGAVPEAGDFSIAVDFSVIGNEAQKDNVYTPLSTTTEQATVSLDYGASAGSRLTDRGVNDRAEEFNLANWSTGSEISDAIEDNVFVSVNVTPASGLSVELQGVSFDFWRNGADSPTRYGIMTNLDGFESGDELGTIAVSTSGENNVETFQVAGTEGLSTTGNLEVRLYGWDANATSGHTHLTAAELELRFATVDGFQFRPTGNLNIAGDFLHADGASLEIGFTGLDNSNPEELQFDALDVDGAVVLAGDLVLDLQSDYQIGDGDQFTFLTGEQISGSFANVRLNGAMGWTPEVIYGSNSVAVRFTAIPEPASISIVCLIACIVCQRRSRESV